MIEQKTHALNVELTEQIEPQILALVRMAKHWEQERDLQHEDWAMEARLNIEDFRGYRAIAWVEPSSQIRWVVPFSENSVLQNFRLDSEPQRRAALEDARRTGQLAITSYVDLVGGGKGFVVVVPIVIDQNLTGYIVGIFQAQTLFNILLDDSDIQDYSIRIYSNNKLLYRRHNRNQADDPTFIQETKITLYDLDWRVRVAPTEDLLKRSQSYLPEVSLLSGLSLSWLLALAVYLAQRSDRTTKTVRKTAAQLKLANQGLEHEISERQQAEQLLQETQQRLKHLFLSSPTVIYSCKAEEDYRATFVSENIVDLFGYTPQDFLTDPNFWLSHIHPDDSPHVVTNLPSLLEHNRANHEYRFQHQNGSYRWVYDDIRLVRDSQGKVIEVVGSIQDVSDRKQAETQLKQSLKELADFKFALDASSIVSITDCQGTIQYVNDKFCQVSQYTRAELIGQKHSIVSSGHHPIEFYTQLWETIANGNVWKGEFCNHTKNGSLYWVDTTIVPLLDHTQRPIQYFAINIDITEKKILEKQFLRVQRMESLGTLASGIAHDLNNVLAPIMMATQLLKMKDQEEYTQQWLQIMEGSAKRGADLVKQVLSFARGTDGERTILQISYIIHEIKQILEETFPKDITLRVDVSHDLWAVCGDTTQLHQVLMNLCINARDAMPKGGTLCITAKNFIIDESYTRLQIDAKPGSYVEIAVVDTGIGIPSHILDRIFDPFFTTKEFGKGTGMGLSTVIGIIKSHAGLITVSSKVGQGSEFKVYIPVAEQPAQQPLETETLPLGQGELILVVDDETAICKIAQASLSAHHYRVITASTGAQAIALYTQQMQDINLVLVDMMMPEIDGLAVMQTLRKLNPAVQFVVMSGLISSTELSSDVDSSVMAFLSKPFTTNTLLTTINRALKRGVY